MMSEKIDFIGLGFCSNDYLSLLPKIQLDSKLQILEHLIQSSDPAVSALKCGKLGGRTGVPTREEMNKFLQKRAL